MVHDSHVRAPLAPSNGQTLPVHQNGKANAQTRSAVPPVGLAIAYVRVSTAEQAEGLSLEGQVAKLKLVAALHGWELEVVSDSQSAKDVNRPALKACLERLKSGEAKALLVARLDRLTRRTADFYDLMDAAANEGWALVCLEPAVDMTSPFGRAMAGMAAVFAQLERELIAQRQRDSVAIRKARGVYRNHPPRVAPEVEKRVRAMRESGKSYRHISDVLIGDGVSPPNGGTEWHHKTLTTIVRRGA